MNRKYLEEKLNTKILNLNLDIGDHFAITLKNSTGDTIAKLGPSKKNLVKNEEIIDEIFSEVSDIKMISKIFIGKVEK